MNRKYEDAMIGILVAQRGTGMPTAGTLGHLPPTGQGVQETSGHLPPHVFHGMGMLPEWKMTRYRVKVSLHRAPKRALR